MHNSFANWHAFMTCSSPTVFLRMFVDQLRRVRAYLAASIRHMSLFPLLLAVILLSANTGRAETELVPVTKVYRGSVTWPCTEDNRSQVFAFPSLDLAVRFVLASTPSYADCKEGVFRYYDLISANQTGPRTYEIIGRSQHDGSIRVIAGVLVQHDCPPETNVGSDTCKVMRPEQANKGKRSSSKRLRDDDKK